MAARVAASIALAGLVLSACGAGDEVPTAALRLTLERADGAEPAPGEEVIGRFGPDGWTVTADAEPDPPAPLLFVSAELDGEPLLLRRAADLDPARFDVVRVSAAFWGSGEIRARLLRGDDVVGETSAEPLLISDEPAAIDLPLGAELRAAGPCDKIELDVRGGHRLLGLAGVELVRVPLESLVPRPDGPGELFRIGGEERRGVGLTTRAGLETAFEAAPEAELSFSYGVPADLRAAEPVALVVRLEDAGGARLDRRLEVHAGRWEHARLPLGGLAGDLRLSIALETFAGEAACVVAEPVVAAPVATRPNVLLVTTDTHRGDHLGRAGLGVAVETPGLDALADRGVLFERCFASVNATNPSHVALLTGRHPRDTGILGNRTRLSDAAATLAEAFAERGYATWGAVSAPHLLDHHSGFGQGFERFAGHALDVRDAADAVDDVARWLEQRDARPVFAWVHVFDAHWPYDPPAGLAERYAAERVEPADGSLEARRDAAASRWRADYKAEVTYLDRELGRLFAHDAFARAVVAVVGDHGEAIAEHGVLHDHVGLYPSSLHVPLILAWPDGPRGRRVPGLVPHGDLGRTLLDLAGLGAAPFPGRNLLSALEDGEPERPLFAVHAGWDSASVTRGADHLILHLSDHEQPAGGRAFARHELELYDLGADPGCTSDLVEREPGRAAELARVLVAWLEAREDLAWGEGAAQDSRLDEELRKLGYAGGGEGGDGSVWERDGCAWCRRFLRNG